MKDKKLKPSDKEIMKPRHYDMPIPPIEYILKNDLDYCSGSIITLASAWKKRGTPVQDLKKIIQFATFLIEHLSRPKILGEVSYIKRFSLNVLKKCKIICVD